MISNDGSYPWTATWYKPMTIWETTLPKQVCKVLTKYVDISTLSDDNKQFVLTLNSKIRLLNDHLIYDMKNITSPCENKDLGSIINTIDLEYWRTNIPFVEWTKTDWKTLGRSTSGPNGSPAWITSVYDRYALEQEPKLKKSIIRLAELTFNNFNDWKKVFDETYTYSLNLVNVKKTYKTGRLAAIADYSGKTRIICIGDYYSQEVLKPLNDYLFKVLRKLKGDSTYNTNRSIDRIKYWHNHGFQTWSYDLSAATDRFPASIIKFVISKQLTVELADLWYQILVNRNFYVKKGTQVRYKCGQPMGMLSSWGSFSLAHHTLVRILESELGLRVGHNYVILGDDIVISNYLLADKYLSTMTEIGVKISLHKSLIPNKQVPFQAEFAKRVIIAGREVSAFPLKLLKERSKHIAYAKFLSNSYLRTSWNPERLDRLIVNFSNEINTLFASLLQFRDAEMVKIDYQAALDFEKELLGGITLEGNDGPVILGYERVIIPNSNIPVKLLWNIAKNYVEQLNYPTGYSQTLITLRKFCRLLRSDITPARECGEEVLDNKQLLNVLMMLPFSTPGKVVMSEVVDKTNSLIISKEDFLEKQYYCGINGLDDLRDVLLNFPVVKTYNNMLSMKRVKRSSQESRLDKYLLPQLSLHSIDDLKVLFWFNISNTELKFNLPGTNGGLLSTVMDQDADEAEKV